MTSARQIEASAATERSVEDDDGLLGAGGSGVADCLLLVCGHDIKACGGVAIEVAENECLGSGHGAERVPLTLVGIDSNLHRCALTIGVVVMRAPAIVN